MGVDLLIYSVCHLLLFGFSFDVVFVLVIVTFILCHFVFAFFFCCSFSPPCLFFRIFVEVCACTNRIQYAFAVATSDLWLIYLHIVRVYTLLIECIPRFFDSWSFYVFHFFERQQKSFLLKSICFDWFGVLWHFSSFFLFSLEIDFSIHCNHIIALFFIHCHAIQSIRKPLSPKYNFKIKLKAVPSNISRFHSVLLFGLL